MDLILRFAWLSTMVTSMSAMADLFSHNDSAMATEFSDRVELVEYCGKVKNSEKGVEESETDPPPPSELLFVSF